MEADLTSVEAELQRIESLPFEARAEALEVLIEQLRVSLEGIAST